MSNIHSKPKIKAKSESVLDVTFALPKKKKKKSMTGREGSRGMVVPC